ncbi:MAG: HAD-IB family hydrolase, partial [Candidatus Paceibacterota bacterium]
MKNKQQKVAIFDIDGTLFRSSLLIELVEKLMEEKILPEDSYQGFNKEKQEWMERKGSYENYI